MVLVYDSVDVYSNSLAPADSSKNDILEDHMNKVGGMSEEAFISMPRIVEKDGTLNVINKPGWVWFNPFDFSNLLEMKWFSFILLFAFIYATTFISFGGLFYLLSHLHHDQKDHEEDGSVKEGIVCYEGVETFAEAFLFAMETSQTIGYGTRFPSSECPDGIMLLLINIFWTTFLATLFAGIFLAKFGSTNSVGDIRFSSSALISMRNGSMFLMFRVADPVVSGLDYGAEAQAICVNYRGKGKEYGDKITISTELNFLHVQHIAVGFELDGTNNQIPLMWPTIVSHRIDKTSPLYRISPDQLKASRMEIIVTMRGSRSETGGSIDSKTSYTTKEIVWGARFCHKTVLDREEMINIASFSQEDIDKYVKDNTPMLSVEEIDKIKLDVELD